MGMDVGELGDYMTDYAARLRELSFNRYADFLEL
jgi:hypothetical protein